MSSIQFQHVLEVILRTGPFAQNLLPALHHQLEKGAYVVFTLKILLLKRSSFLISYHKHVFAFIFEEVPYKEFETN